MGTSVATELLARDIRGETPLDIRGVLLFNGSVIVEQGQPHDRAEAAEVAGRPAVRATDERALVSPPVRAALLTRNIPSRARKPPISMR